MFGYQNIYNKSRMGCISKLSSVFDKLGLGSKYREGAAFQYPEWTIYQFLVLSFFRYFLYTKNILILLLFYLFQLFLLKNYFNFFMFQDVPECSVMFCVPRFVDGRISFRLADRV